MAEGEPPRPEQDEREERKEREECKERIAGMSCEDVKKEVEELQRRPVESFPLFMTDLPADLQDNVALQALQAMVYEGTPSEQALNFKQQGNDCFVLGPAGYPDAIHYYTRGLEVGCGEAGTEATLHLNRAAAHLGLGNWAEALRDARRALQLDEEMVFVKAHRRILRAALPLRRPSEARASLQALQQRGETVDAATEEELRRLEEEVAKYRAAQQAKEALLAQIRRTVGEGSGVEVVEGAEAHLQEHFGPELAQQLLGPNALPTVQRDPRTRRRLWPVLLLYPAAAQSDLLAAVDESTRIGELLQLVFAEPAPWDVERQYCRDLSKLRVFWHDHREGQRLIEIRHTRCIADLLGQLIKHIERGILSFYVVAPGGPADELLRRFHHDSVGSF